MKMTASPKYLSPNASCDGRGVTLSEAKTWVFKPLTVGRLLPP